MLRPRPRARPAFCAMRDGVYCEPAGSPSGRSSDQRAQHLARAAGEQRILISADMDFGFLLASRRAVLPSVVLLRRLAFHRTDFVVSLLLMNLLQLAEALDQGSLVVRFSSGRHLAIQPASGKEHSGALVPSDLVPVIVVIAGAARVSTHARQSRAGGLRD